MNEWIDADWFAEWVKMARKTYQGNKIYAPFTYEIEKSDEPNNLNKKERKVSE
jgi:hypothetical protein